MNFQDGRDLWSLIKGDILSDSKIQHEFKLSEFDHAELIRLTNAINRLAVEVSKLVVTQEK